MKHTTSMRTPLVLTLCGALLALSPAGAAAQQADEVNDLIRKEGLERSKVMETLHHLTDVFGPRLTGSPSLDRAGEWALQRLEGWGLENAHKEAWDWGHPGWENDRFSAHIVSPVRDALVGEVLAWTPGTDGPVRTGVFHLVPPEDPTQEELDAYLAEHREAVEGQIVLVGALSTPRVFDAPQRYDDEEMERRYDPHGEEEGRSYGNRAAPEPGTLSGREVSMQVDAFLKAHGAAARVDPSGMDAGLIRAFANRTYDPAQAVPTIILRNEDYGRLVRLEKAGMPVELEIDVANSIYPEGETAYNYIAEIPGAERPEEVVMIGGHLDSWHAATGATDNAAGCAVMMEAARILQEVFEQTGTRPRRTIRVALWSGEEQGLLGSQAYVAEHFGTVEEPRPAHAGFGGYFNVDSGTGRLRGASVFGPVEAAEVLDAAFEPFVDLAVHGARATDSRRRGGSDHTSFNSAGLPGIGMGQDPIRYFTHTWHTNIDTYEHLLEEDLRQAAVVVAAGAYHLATREDLLPRFDAQTMPPGTE